MRYHVDLNSAPLYSTVSSTISSARRNTRDNVRRVRARMPSPPHGLTSVVIFVALEDREERRSRKWRYEVGGI